MALLSSFVGITGFAPPVTNGLLTYLDAAFYPGTGSAWSDLSGNNNTATLVNSPTYSNDNGNYFLLNGTNQQINLSTTYSSVVNNFSAEVWCLPLATISMQSESNSGTAGVVAGVRLIRDVQSGSNAGFGLLVGTNGVQVAEHAAGYLPILLAHTITINSVSQIVIVYNNKQPLLYINGVFVKSGATSTISNILLNGSTIGTADYGGFWSGRLHALRYYDRALSASEVTQNFNALRGRYGI
jgi:hypothetical protein